MMGRFPDTTGFVFPNAITDDGAFVFGGLGDAFSIDPPVAFVWSSDKGMRSLTDVVKAAGIAIPDGMMLQNVLAVSGDGTVLIGTAADATSQKTFVLRVAAGTF